MTLDEARASAAAVVAIYRQLVIDEIERLTRLHRTLVGEDSPSASKANPPPRTKRRARPRKVPPAQTQSLPEPEPDPTVDPETESAESPQPPEARPPESFYEARPRVRSNFTVINPHRVGRPPASEDTNAA